MEERGQWQILVSETVIIQLPSPSKAFPDAALSSPVEPRCCVHFHSSSQPTSHGITTNSTTRNIVASMPMAIFPSPIYPTRLDRSQLAGPRKEMGDAQKLRSFAPSQSDLLLLRAVGSDHFKLPWNELHGISPSPKKNANVDVA